MSKLFPMFKKKGKGKEDILHEEDTKKKIVSEDTKRKSVNEDDTRRKIRAKAERVKDALKSPVKSSSPSLPGKLNKSKKKGKGSSKDKTSVNGKVLAHLPGEAEMHQVEEMYIDNDGNVKISHSDDIGVILVEEVCPQEGDRSSSLFDEEEEEDEEDSISDDDKVSRESIIVQQTPADTDADAFPEQERLNNLEPSQCSDNEVNDHSEQETATSPGAEETDVKHESVDEKVLDKENQGEVKTESDEVCENPDVTGEKLIEVTDDADGQQLTEGDTSDLSYGDALTSISETKSKNLHEDEGDTSEKLTSEKTIPSSQDSDEDFDSAQEDWEDDDDGIGHSKGSRKVCFGQSPRGKQAPESAVIEATNVILADNGKAKSSENMMRSPSRGSSEYEDTLVLPDGASGETSDDKPETVSDDSSRARRKSGSDKLVRKLSGLSTTSSDAFNEELDDLLDEELDRLSEGEETEAEKKENVNAVHESEVDSGETQVSPPEMADEQPDALLSKEATKHEEVLVCKDGVIEDSGGEAIQTPISDPDISPPTKESSSNVEESSSSDKKDNTIAGSHLAPADDQVKDSGYYSLPVSPNPSAVVRGSSEGDQGSKVVDDSFGDSEEDGMITPPAEGTALKDTPENSEEITGDPKDKEIVETKDAMKIKKDDGNASCSQESSEAEASSALKEDEGSAEAHKKTSEAKTDLPNPKQDVNLKVIIPKNTQEEKKDGILSPKCGSPTKSRFKSPLKDMEETFSPDPVGDRFLKEAVLLSHEEAEARLAQRRAARAEARELRLRELEKQQQDQENDEEKQFTSPSFAEPSPRAPVATRTSVGRTAALNSTGQYSRRSSEDSTTDESALPANVREMRAELKELDEKFRKAMITNAQLDNEKSTLTYEVELLKDKYTELEETHTQLNKEHRKKCTEYEQLRKVSTKLQEEVKILRGMLQERDQLIQEYGLIVVGEEEENGEVPPEPDEFDDMDDLTPRKIAVKKVLLSQEAADLLSKGAAKGSLDVRLKKFGEEKNDLEDEVRRLKLELEEERNKNRRRENGLDYEKQKEQSKTVNEYKFRVQKAEAEVLTLQANVARLDALSMRYKTQSEELEKSEEELKLEKRKLQRELRDAQNRLEELETTNNHLIRRFDKLKNARSTLLKDLSQDPV